jgi:hypothetical protein
VSISAIGVRRPIGGISGQALLLGACAVSAAVWVGLVGLQSRHAFLHEAAPVLLVPLVLWLFFSERYEVTLAVLLLYLGLLDGFVKLASGSNLATIVRDALLYAVALGAVVRMILRKTPVTLPPFVGLVLAWVAVCVMQLANPSDVSVTHAAAALRQHLEFVPLFFLGYFVLRGERRLAGLLLLLLIVATANGAVGLIQTRLTPGQLASWGPGYAGLVNGTSTRVARVFVNATGQAQIRPPGLGGTDGFGGTVGLLALPAALALLSSARRTVRMGWLLIPGTVLTIVAIVTSQTRTDVVGGVIALIAFLALTLTSRRGLTTLVVTTVIGLAGYGVVSAFVSSSSNRYSTIAPSKVLGAAISSRQGALALIPTYIADYPLGAGIGSVGPAAASAIGGSALGRGLSGEDEMVFLLVETGIPGLLVMVAFTITVIGAGLRLRRMADPQLQRYLMALTAALISLLAVWFVGPVTSDSPTSPFIWLSAGCLAYWYGEFRAGRLQMRTRVARRALATR